MDDSTVLAVVVGFVAILILVAAVLLALGLYVIYRYRLPLRAIAAMAASFVYLVSPVDAAPEAALGPFGMLDDAGIVSVVAFYVFRLVKARRTNLPIRQAAGIAFRETTREGLDRYRKGELRRPKRDERR